MPKVKQKFYDLKNILKLNAQYNILLGERANGKSYQCKKYVLEHYKESKNKFIILRRSEIETKAAKIESYFDDVLGLISSIYKGEYDRISVYRGKIYLAKLDDKTEKIVRGDQIGDVIYLSGARHFKSLSYPNTDTIIFEEFATDGLYLFEEPDTLQELVSTVFRRRNGKVFLVGNMISRTCPYFNEWQLSRVPRQKQGTIDTYDIETNQYNADGTKVVIKIAVEYCENSGANSKMFFGHSEASITSGAWKVKDQHKQPELDSAYDLIYEFKLSHMNFNFCCQLKVNANNGGLILFVYPLTRNKDFLRTITKQFSDSPFISEYLNPSKFEVERHVIDCLKMKKVCFSDNLTGTDFWDILLNMGGIY